MSGADVEYRRAAPEDLDFVVSSWTSSYKSAHAAGILSITPLDVPCARCSEPQPYDFTAVMGHTIRHLLRRPGLEVWVAANPRAKAPYNLHGYLVCERDANVPSYRYPDFKLVIERSPHPLVHYVFVKQTYRGNGFARALLGAAGIDPTRPFLYSCKTPAVAQLEGVVKGTVRNPNKIPQARWSPLCVRFEKESKIP